MDATRLSPVALYEWCLESKKIDNLIRRGLSSGTSDSESVDDDAGVPSWYAEERQRFIEEEREWDRKCSSRNQ